MPELPEVENARCLVENKCVGGTIVQVSEFETGGGPRSGQHDDIVVCDGVSADCLATTLLGRKLVAVQRKGKHLWCSFGDSGVSLLFHFGMTGALVVRGIEPLAFQEFKVHCEAWPPRFCKLEIQFVCYCLLYTSPSPRDGLLSRMPSSA